MKTQALDEPKQVLKIGEKTKVRRISHAFWFNFMMSYNAKMTYL
jgi:hypothetical protein